jgi:hypothetical protein
MHVHVNGRACKEYSHNGNTYIEARHGTNYTVKVKNDNPHRVMIVVSVDGLDVISGKAAAETDTGYIIDAYGNLDIKGYRISDDDCASFIFTSRGKSYVQQTKGDARNCGVIGLRAFKEKTNWTTLPYVYPTLSTTCTTTTLPLTVTADWNHTNIGNTTTGVGNVTSYNCSINCSNVSSTPAANTGVLRSLNFDTGTGWGNKIEQSVEKVNFEKGSMLTEMTLYYASMEALEEMGVDTKPLPKVAAMPQAFGYCKPPKGWNG